MRTTENLRPWRSGSALPGTARRSCACSGERNIFTIFILWTVPRCDKPAARFTPVSPAARLCGLPANAAVPGRRPDPAATMRGQCVFSGSARRPRLRQPLLKDMLPSCLRAKPPPLPPSVDYSLGYASVLLAGGSRPLRFAGHGRVRNRPGEGGDPPHPHPRRLPGHDPTGRRDYPGGGRRVRR